MKYILILMAMIVTTSTHGQTLNLEALANFEIQLEDVMEIIDKKLVVAKLEEVENAFRNNPTEINEIRLGLIYHEVSLNLTFFDKTKKYTGYAQRSYDLLTKLGNNKKTTPELQIYIASYRASALSLVAAETKKLKLLGQAFELFGKAVTDYAAVSPRPEFMRGSVAENLPFFMWKKKKYAKIDFQSIIEKQEKKADYADFRIMSFSYWAWARAYHGKKFRKQALDYLDRAIEIDPNYMAGRKRAEELKSSYLGKE